MHHLVTSGSRPFAGLLPGARHLGLVTAALALVLACLGPSLAATLSIKARGTYLRLTPNGRLVVKKDFAQTPYEEEVVLRLKGIVIPTSAVPRAAAYAGNFTQGSTLSISITAQAGNEYTAEVFVQRSGKTYSLNKTFLVFGFAYLDRGDPDCRSWDSYEASARRNRWGLWSEGQAKWPRGAELTGTKAPAAKAKSVPSPAGQAPEVGDRRAIIARYGKPDQTLTTFGSATYVRGIYGAPPMYVFDRYYKLGLTFVYRNGQLVDKRDGY